jgi:hypothetical protein
LRLGPAAPRRPLEAEELTDRPDHCRKPEFSPDGRRLLFITNRHTNWEIYVLDLDSRMQTRVTYDIPTIEADASWIVPVGMLPVRQRAMAAPTQWASLKSAR